MGIRKIAVFASHGGNFAFVEALEAGYEGRSTLAGYSDLGRFLHVMMAAAVELGLHVPATDVHAGGLETSMMLAAYPDTVRPFAGVNGYTGAEPGWLERIFEEGIRPVSESGVLGDVSGANREVGDALFAALADELSGYFTNALDL
jgi:creatinine amidohydrolase/Fe(II)-dependent formamide hydrolase-like protein